MRVLVVAVATCFSIVSLSVASDADAALRRPTSIDAQPLASALQRLAKERGFQILYRTEVVGERRTAGAAGDLTVDEALTRLLSGTGLTYEYLDPHTVTIVPAVSGGDAPDGVPAAGDGEARTAVPSTSGNTQAPSSGGRLRFAQAGQGPYPSDAARSAADARRSVAELEEIVVTGSRLRSREEGPSPVTIFDRAKIDELGVSTVPDLLRYLPQQAFTDDGYRNFGGAQYAQLRGMDADSTLVLINGRRAVPSAANVAFNAFDLNAIPLAAIERVEILSDSASAVYGADAVGGVVNIVLKKRIPHPTVDLSFGAAEGGGEEQRISLSAGYARERFRSSLILDYFDRDHLLGEERERWADIDFRRFGGSDHRVSTTNPANISSRTGENLPGLPSTMAAVPPGSSGVGLTPADFLATAGTQNQDSTNRFWSVVPAAERFGVAVFSELDLTPRLTAFGELLYSDRSNASQTGPATLSNALVPETNPFNPFGVPVSVRYLFTGIGPRVTRVESELLRAVMGLRGTLRSWDWELSVLRADEDAKSWTENNVDTARVNAALAATDPDQALNVFQDGPGGSPALLESLIAEPVFSNYASKATQGTGFLRGPLFALPAGEVELVVGAEGRSEDILFDSAPTFVSSDRTTRAAFVETRIPLVSAATSWPAVGGLALTVAARYDDYSDFGDTFNPQLGLTWNPVANLTVRASYGTSFRPPALYELHSPRREAFGASAVDPRRNNESVSVSQIYGGNPDLEATEAESLTTGIVYTAPVLDGLRLSASYWRINLEKKVQSPRVQLVVNNEALFPERVVRDAPSPADVAAGLPGPILAVDTSYINTGQVQTSGVDLEASLAFETRLGRFAPRLSATWVDEYTAVTMPGTDAVERVGIANVSGSIPRWRIVGSLAWARAGAGLSVTARYLPSYDDATFDGVPTGRTIPSQTLVDAQATLDLDGVRGEPPAWLQGLKIALGASNLFDKEPPFSEAFAYLGYDVTQGELRGRFLYARLSKRF